MPQMIVLDSHIWFWWINQDRRLSGYLTSQIEDADQVGVSPVSCFELALAHKKGRLTLTCPLEQWFGYALGNSGVTLLPLSPQIASRAVALSDVHRDPFDRIIIATALDLDAQLASADATFNAYPELDKCLLKLET